VKPYPTARPCSSPRRIRSFTTRLFRTECPTAVVTPAGCSSGPRRSEGCGDAHRARTDRLGRGPPHAARRCRRSIALRDRRAHHEHRPSETRRGERGRHSDTPMRASRGSQCHAQRLRVIHAPGVARPRVCRSRKSSSAAPAGSPDVDPSTHTGRSSGEAAGRTRRSPDRTKDSVERATPPLLTSIRVHQAGVRGAIR